MNGLRVAETTASFSILGEFSPEGATELLGIAPKASWRRGGGITGHAVTDGWRVALAPVRAIDTEALIEQLLDLLEPNGEQLLSLRDEADVELTMTLSANVVSDEDQALPSPRVTAAVMSRLVALGVDLVLDYTMLTGD